MDKLSMMEEDYKTELKNKFFGLLCEYEKDEEWEAFLDSIIIELETFSDEEKTVNYIKLLNKTNSLRYLSYKYFRKTIFDCMNLIGKLQ